MYAVREWIYLFPRYSMLRGNVVEALAGYGITAQVIGNEICFEAVLPNADAHDKLARDVNIGLCPFGYDPSVYVMTGVGRHIDAPEAG